MSKVKDFISDLAVNETANIDYINHVGKQLSLESSSQVFADSLKQRLSDFFTNAVNYLSITKYENYKSKAFDPSRYLLDIREKGFMNIRGQSIEIPAGFRGRFIDLLSLISGGLPAIHGIEANLKNLNTRIAHILTERDVLKAQSGIAGLVNINSLIDEPRYNALNEFFHPDGKTVARVQDVYYRLEDINQTYALAMQVDKELSKINVGEIKTLIERNTELGIKLAGYIKEIGDGVISGTSGKQLAEVVYHFAMTVTFLSKVMYVMDELMLVLRRNANV